MSIRLTLIIYYAKLSPKGGIVMTPIEQKIESVVDNILLDYQNNRDIARLELYRHPD